jgi:hypothetical protein
VTKEERAKRLVELRAEMRVERVRPDVNAAHCRELEYAIEKLLAERAKDDGAWVVTP